MSKQQPDFYDVYIQEHWRKTLAEEPIYDASMNILHRPKRKMRQNKWLKENNIIYIS